MLYHIFEAFYPVPNMKGTLFSKSSLGKNHNGKALGSQLLQMQGVNSDDRSINVFMHINIAKNKLKTCSGAYLDKNLVKCTFMSNEVLLHFY